MIDITQLYTRYPEDIKKVVDCAIEITKAQSLKDTGVELLPFPKSIQSALTDEEYDSQRFYLPETDRPFLTWVDCKYVPKHLNLKELTTNIVKRFPDIEFEMTYYYEDDPQGEWIKLWDGNEWREAGYRLYGEKWMRVHCEQEAFKEAFGYAVHYFACEEEAVNKLHEHRIVPAEYTTLESIAAYLEEQGCSVHISDD